MHFFYAKFQCDRSISIFLRFQGHTSSCITVEDSGESHSESENSVSDSVDENDDSVAEISRSFRSRQELCEQLNVNHMIQRIFLITLDNSKYKEKSTGQWWMCVKLSCVSVTVCSVNTLSQQRISGSQPENTSWVLDFFHAQIRFHNNRWGTVEAAFFKMIKIIRAAQ